MYIGMFSWCTTNEAYLVPYVLLEATITGWSSYPRDPRLPSEDFVSNCLNFACPGANPLQRSAGVSKVLQTALKAVLRLQRR